MSEPLFDREKHLNLYKPRPTGILHFSKMQGKKEFQSAQTYMNMPQDTLIPSLDGNSRKKAILAILAASNKKKEMET